MEEVYKKIIQKIVEVYCYAKEHKSVEEFNNDNDLGLIKIMKLFYFYVLFNSEGNETTDIDGKELKDFNFYALPYGHVEVTLYDAIKNAKEIEGLLFKKEKLLIKDSNFIDFPINHKKFNNGQSVLLNLKHKNVSLNLQEPFSLVELSHQLFSWETNYNIALSMNKRAKEIGVNDIIYDYQLISDEYKKTN